MVFVGKVWSICLIWFRNFVFGADFVVGMIVIW